MVRKFENLSKILKKCSTFDTNYIKRLLDYNVDGGKQIRYKIFKSTLDKHNITHNDDNLFIGYLIEVLHAAFLIIDDIMDNGDTRRGKDCWYKIQHMKALRDGRFLTSVFSTFSLDSKISSDVIFSTCIGQTLDSMEKLPKDYTWENYKSICEYKTGIYTFYLPLIMGYKIMNIEPPSYLYEFCKLCGLLYQIQDDFLNFIPDISNKTSNDLEEKKLTYFTVILRTEMYDEDAVKNYFEDDVISNDFMKKLESIFPRYKEENTNIINRLKNYVNREGVDVLSLCLHHLEKRANISKNN